MSTDYHENQQPAPAEEAKSVRSEAMDQLVSCLIRASIVLAGFIAIHLAILGVFHALNRGAPKVLTFPRFDVQLAMALNPPIAYSAAQLASFASLQARSMGLIVTVLLALPLSLWFVWRLTLTNLIVWPLIYYSQAKKSSTDEPLIQSSYPGGSDSPLENAFAQNDAVSRSTEDSTTERPLRTQSNSLQGNHATYLDQVHELEPFTSKAFSVPCSPNISSDDLSVLSIRPSTDRGTSPTRVDKETGEITLTCPSTRLLSLPHGKDTMRLNPHRSSESTVSASPLLTPPHRQRWVEFDRESVALPGSDSSEVFHTRSSTAFPHDAFYKDALDAGRSSFASVEQSWVTPSPPPPPDSPSPGPTSLPPLPLSASVKYLSFQKGGDSTFGLGHGPIAEGYYDSTTDSEACRLLLLRPLMRERTTTEGGRSTASLSALDFRDELPGWDKVRPRSVPLLSDRNRVAGAPVYGCSTTEGDEHLEWRLMERKPKFIAGYGFAFEDVLGTDHAKGRFRARPSLLWTHAIFFVSRVMAAAVFGFWGAVHKSWIQISLLIIIQAFTTIHLLVYSPFASRLLQCVESMVAVAELIIVTGAAVLLLELQVDLTNSIMVGGFYFVSCTLLAFELRRLDLPLKKLWRACMGLRKKYHRDS